MGTLGKLGKQVLDVGPVIVVMAAMAGFVGWIVVSLVAGIAVEEQCARAGYANARITWRLDGYCIARVDQTDIVVPVEEARRHPRTGTRDEKEKGEGNHER